MRLNTVLCYRLIHLQYACISPPLSTGFPQIIELQADQRPRARREGGSCSTKWGAAKGESRCKQRDRKMLRKKLRISWHKSRFYL
eukprot:1724687-Rhodomonas_salina.1